MLVRGIYYEGWDPSMVPVKIDREEFMARVRQEFPYDTEGGTEPLVQAVLGALKRRVTDGEWEDIKSTVPKQLVTVMP